MSKTVIFHQPNYLPWIGLFSKASQADCFIICDTAQYVSGSVINRNKVRTSTGWCYLSIPVGRSWHETRIVDVPMPQDRKWQEKHWKTISRNYAKSGFFKEHEGFFEQLYCDEFEYLWEINEKILLYLLKSFKIHIEVVKSSQMEVDPHLKRTDLIIACLKETGADVYLSGPTGKDYLEVEKFAYNGIALKFSQFEHPVYPQRYPGFEPNMAAIDLLFNVGPKAVEVIKNSGSVEDSPGPCGQIVPSPSL